MTLPHGIAEIRALYGDPRPLIREDGTVMPAWERRILVTVELPASLRLGWDRPRRVERIRVNRQIAPLVATTFGQIYRDGLWHLIETFDGCYAWRAKRNGQRLSLHAWGAAIDLNAASNPLGLPSCQDSRLIDAFQANGWEWGGTWSTPDPMHLQVATGY